MAVQYDNVPAQQIQDKPMKWHKFLIYFSFWAGALVYIVNAIQLFTGSVYGGEAYLVYSMFGALKLVDKITALLYIGLAVYAIAVRFALAGFKANGPRMLTQYFIACMVVNILYNLVGGMAIGQVMWGSIVSGCVGSLVMLLINKSYYDKRIGMFVN